MEDPAKSWRHLFLRLKKQKIKLTSPGMKKGDIRLSALIPFSTARASKRSGVRGKSSLTEAVRKRMVAFPRVGPRKKSSLFFFSLFAEPKSRFKVEKFAFRYVPTRQCARGAILRACGRIARAYV